MKAAGLLVGLVVALALQTTIVQFAFRGRPVLDLVLLVVVYTGLAAGPIWGLLAGSLGGLAQDALSSGLLGVGGLLKTLIGFAAGAVGSQLLVVTTARRFLVFFVATVAQILLLAGLYVLLEGREFRPVPSVVAGHAAANALAGVLGARLIEWVPRAWERRAKGPIRR